MEKEPCAITFDEIKDRRVIGEGTFGTVYEATYRGKKIALKKFRQKDESIWQEVEALTKTKHRHIVKFIGTTENHKHNKMLVMEYMSDGSLADLFQQPNIKLDMKEKLRIAIDIAKGLRYLHELQPKIIHRDLKPDNILLFDAKKRAKITDFGCSRVLQKTKTETIVGTIGFFAPEVAEEKPYNEKADIYSFGVLLYSLFLNINKGLALDEEERQKQIKSLPDGCFKDLILICCNKDPLMRPTAPECVQDLKSEYYKKEMLFMPKTIPSQFRAAMIEENIAASAALKKEFEIKQKYSLGTIFIYNKPGHESLFALLRWIKPPNLATFVLLDRHFEEDKEYIVIQRIDLTLGRLPPIPTIVVHDSIYNLGINDDFIPVACLSNGAIRKIKMKIARMFLEDEE